MLKDLTIVIPSSGRADKQITYKQLPTKLRMLTKLAIPTREYDEYKKADAPLWLIPNAVKGISETRKFIMENCVTRYVLMLDDDMTFAKRKSMATAELQSLACGAAGITVLVTQWLANCKLYAHVGLSARQGNNRVNKPLVECGRMFNAYMYNLEEVRAARPILGRLPVMEDFDLTLQLLRYGKPNAIMYDYCWNQSGSNTSGGCSQYRTNKMQAEAAHKLAKLHPGFVRVVEKKSKNWGPDMEVRTDVVVSWKKAYESSFTANGY